ncbi:MAG: RNA polymerase sigma factor [Bacteroidota bacterium]
MEPSLIIFMEMENPFSKNGYSDSTDIGLIRKILGGDKTSLNDLLGRHQDFIFNVALKMLNNIQDAEDVTQEILIKIVTQLSKYDNSKAKFRTWLYRITFNHVLNMKKNQYETVVSDFSAFFGFIDKAPNLAVSQEEEREMQEVIEESKVACMAGMIMCLDRMQRLVYIVGEVFSIDHNLAAEIFETTPDNFRQKLSRARKDLYNWMHKQCGLVNLENPCRCKSKTKSFIDAGYVDPKNLKWHSNYKHRMFEMSEAKINEALNARDEIYRNLYTSHPFKTSLKAKEVYQTIMNNKDFASIMKLN